MTELLGLGVPGTHTKYYPNDNSSTHEGLFRVPAILGEEFTKKFKDGMSVGKLMLYLYPRTSFALDEDEEIGPDPTLRADEIPTDPKKTHAYSSSSPSPRW